MARDHGSTGGGDFAVRLRARRLTAGLTQAELAAKAGVGIRTVRDLERGRAARPQRTTVELLATALGLDGEERSGFVAASRRSATAGPAMTTAWMPRTPDRPATLALPAPIPLIGRERELSMLTDLIVPAGGAGRRAGAARPVTVTLTGLAGVGKSSLGIAVLHKVAAYFPGGVAGIAVTEGAAEADLLAAVATVFAVDRAADLPERLAAPALLMVDAVEQSPAAAQAVRWLHAHAPGLRILASGRRRLGVPDERTVQVEPLEVPPPSVTGGLAEVARYAAAALFLTRLTEVRRTPVTDAEAAALATLVRRLGGVPLALELAAARGRVLDAGELLERYGHRLLDLAADADADLTLGLREAVAGSYNVLDPAARRALRQLSVFRARWSVELAEGLLADVGDPVAVLDRLVGLGLVTVRGSGPFRFRLLDVVRQFAAEQAESAGELVAARHRHAQVLAGVAVRTAPEFAGPHLMGAVNRLDHLASDLWSALAAAAEDDPHTALRLASALPRWWRLRGRDVPGRQWLRRLLDDPRTADADLSVRAWAKLGVAQLAQEHGAAQDELPEAEAALVEFRALGDVAGELAARNLLCALWMAGGGYDEARRHGEAALALASRTERVRDMAVAQNNLTWHEIRVADLAAARRRLAAAERLAAQCGELRLRVLARANLAEVARLEGRYDEAVGVARAAAPLIDELGDPGHRRRLLATIGLALAQSGRTAEAHEVVGELRALGGAEAAVAAIEGHLALRRGDRDLAAEWFGTAASASAGRYDARDLVEALVGVAASASSSDRPAALARLAAACRRSGITLVAAEQSLLG
jgi:predicted ATPase/transcriptional regulator with XRE-family HTH domain